MCVSHLYLYLSFLVEATLHRDKIPSSVDSRNTHIFRAAFRCFFFYGRCAAKVRVRALRLFRLEEESVYPGKTFPKSAGYSKITASYDFNLLHCAQFTTLYSQFTTHCIRSVVQY